MMGLGDTGLVVFLHHSLALAVWPVSAEHAVRLPARKRVECRSRDLHQSLLVKLNQARAQHNGTEAQTSPTAKQQSPSGAVSAPPSSPPSPLRPSPILLLAPCQAPGGQMTSNELMAYYSEQNPAGCEKSGRRYLCSRAHVDELLHLPSCNLTLLH